MLTVCTLLYALLLQFSVQSHTLPHLQALAYYLRQNLLQFLYIPKYTDTRPECHFQVSILSFLYKLLTFLMLFPEINCFWS
jgi:hypothetical protein